MAQIPLARGVAELLGTGRGTIGLAAVAALLASTAFTQAIAYPGNAGGKTDACAVQRAPLAARDKQYEDLQKSKVANAVGQGLLVGASALAGGLMKKNSGSSTSGFNPFGEIAKAALGAGAASAGGTPATGFLGFDAGLLSQASALSVPGVSNSNLGGDGKAIAAIAVVTAIAGAISAYMGVKNKEQGGDLRKMSYSIEEDAGRQVPVGRESASQLFSLADCRKAQVDDINGRFAAASNDADRKSLRKERASLEKTLAKDVDMAGDINGREASMAKTFTQGRAMTENTSEASVLGAQLPAYAPTAGTTKLVMQLEPTTAGGVAPAGTAAAAPPPVQMTLMTIKPTVVRTEAKATAGVLLNFPKGREVKPVRRAAADPTWWEVDIGGTPGFVRGADLATADAIKAKPKMAPAKAPEPQFATPTNIREYNRTVLTARTQGQARLSALSADIKTGFRIERKPDLRLAARWAVARKRG